MEGYRLAQIDVHPAGAARLVSRAGSVTGSLLPRDEVEELLTCGVFAPLPDIVRRLAVASADEPEEVQTRVDAWVQAGFLESTRQILSDCIAHTAPEDRPALRDLVILSCDHHALLERSLHSWLAWAAAVGRRVRVTVIDDSSDPVRAEGQRAVCVAAARTFDTTIAFVDHAAKRRLARELALRTGVDRAIVEFAVLGCEPPRFGAGGSRTTCSLIRPDQRVLCADDDVIARFGEPPVRRDGLWITSLPLVREHWYFRTPEEVEAAIHWDPVADPFAEHDRALGRPLAALIQGAGGADLTGVSRSFAASIRAGASRTLLSSHGIAGDSASENAISRLLIAGDSGIRALSLGDLRHPSRELIRTALRPTVAEGVKAMGYLMGIDNAAFVPPHFPISRGEDDAFSHLMTWLHPSGATAIIPGAVLHRPATQRRYAASDFLEPTTQLHWQPLIRHSTRTCPQPPSAYDPAERLALLRGHLTYMARQPVETLVDHVQHITTASLISRANKLAALLEAGDRRAPAWTQAAREALAHTEGLLARRHRYPLESQGRAPAFEGLRDALGRYAEVLGVWGDLRAAARDLVPDDLHDLDWVRA